MCTLAKATFIRPEFYCGRNCVYIRGDGLSIMMEQ